MFDIGIEKLALLLVLALVIFGPDQLPRMAGQAARTLRRLRDLASGAADELKAGLGPEYADLDIADLDPRRFLTRHLLADDVVAASPTPRHSDAGGRPPFDPEAT